MRKVSLTQDVAAHSRNICPARIRMSSTVSASESQFVGSIVGLAVGDALGYPAEFRRRAQLLAEIGPEGITDFIALKDPRFSKPFFCGFRSSAGNFH